MRFNARAAANALECLEERLPVGAALAQEPARGILLLACDGEEQVLGGDVLVLAGIGLAEGEPFRPLNLAAFALIWLGGAVFIYDAWRKTRQLRAAAAV